MRTHRRDACAGLFPPFTLPLTRDPIAQARANAEVLLWQGRVRVALAAVAGGTATVLQQMGVSQGRARWLVGAIVGYIAAIGMLGWRVRRTNIAGNLIVTATVLADLVFIFVS